MTVYVDDMYMPAKLPGMRPAIWCHMMADTPEELHAFARSIGLDRRWAQHEDEPGMLHYDVTKTMRAKAVKAGATEITWRQAGEMAMLERQRALRPRFPSAKKVGRVRT